TDWLSTVDPFLGGNPGSPLGPPSPGDPADLIGTALDQDDEGLRPKMLRSSGGGSVSGEVDLRSFARTGPDPENNPRALVIALANLAGFSDGGALRAADKALGAL